MKCSNCSAVIRPVVAIDIDGTLGDYHSHFIRFAANWLGSPVTFLQVADSLYDGLVPFRQWFGQVFGVDETTFRTIKLAYRQGGMKRSMPIYAGARGLVEGLRSIGAEIWLTTTRPHDRFDRVDPDTREWLRRCNIECDGLLFADDKMFQLAERVEPERVCFVLDDLPYHLGRASELFPNAGTVLRSTAWNRAVGWPIMTGDLLDARAIATAHVQDWLISRSFDDVQPSDFNPPATS